MSTVKEVIQLDEGYELKVHDRNSWGQRFDLTFNGVSRATFHLDAPRAYHGGHCRLQTGDHPLGSELMAIHARAIQQIVAYASSWENDPAVRAELDQEIRERQEREAAREAERDRKNRKKDHLKEALQWRIGEWCKLTRVGKRSTVTGEIKAVHRHGLYLLNERGNPMNIDLDEIATMAIRDEDAGRGKYESIPVEPTSET